MANSTVTALKKKESRGIFLTLILLIHSFLALLFFTVFVGGIFTSGNIINVIKAMQTLPFTTLVISLSIYFLVVATAPLIWLRKKIGIYGLILLFFVCLVEYYTYELPQYLATAHRTNTSPFFLLVQTLWQFLLFSLLYFWALKRKWHLFS
jgi:hypothetical protein